jgi:hypothetical protein
MYQFPLGDPNGSRINTLIMHIEDLLLWLFYTYWSPKVIFRWNSRKATLADDFRFYNVVLENFSKSGIGRPACSAGPPASFVANFLFLTSIGGRDYPFYVMGGIDSEPNGSESRATQESNFLYTILKCKRRFGWERTWGLVVRIYYQCSLPAISTRKGAYNNKH